MKSLREGGGQIGVANGSHLQFMVQQHAGPADFRLAQA